MAYTKTKEIETKTKKPLEPMDISDLIMPNRTENTSTTTSVDQSFIDQLEDKLDLIERHARGLADLVEAKNKRIDELEDALEQRDDRIAELEDESESIESLRNELDEAEDTISEQTEKIQELEQLIEELREQEEVVFKKKKTHLRQYLI
jgi:chromosome segregation ATPase